MYFKVVVRNFHALLMQAGDSLTARCSGGCQCMSCGCKINWGAASYAINL